MTERAYDLQEYSPELTDISRRKCSDMADGAGTVTLRKISANRTDDDFVCQPPLSSMSRVTDWSLIGDSLNCVYIMIVLIRYCTQGEVTSRNLWSRCHRHFVAITRYNVGMVELCAKNLQIMRNDFKDYARTLPIMRTFHVKS